MAGEGETQEQIQVPFPEEVVQAAEDVNHQIEALHNVPRECTTTIGGCRQGFWGMNGGTMVSATGD